MGKALLILIIYFPIYLMRCLKFLSFFLMYNMLFKKRPHAWRITYLLHEIIPWCTGVPCGTGGPGSLAGPFHTKSLEHRALLLLGSPLVCSLTWQLWLPPLPTQRCSLSPCLFQSILKTRDLGPCKVNILVFFFFFQFHMPKALKTIFCIIFIKSFGDGNSSPWRVSSDYCWSVQLAHLICSAPRETMHLLLSLERQRERARPSSPISRFAL